MKTDDYKQELRLSATLHGRNAKKYFLAFKKISKSPEKFCDFFRVAAGGGRKSVESAGMVIGSTPRVGMEISFHKVSQEIQRKIVQALQKLKQKGLGRRAGPTPSNDSRWPISGHDPKSGSSGPY